LGTNAAQSGDRERVREASDIVHIVGELVSLRAKGREYVGLCPFHDDHNPSMAVVPEKQIFHCFVCETGGDVFTFVQKYHGMDFREALEHLAHRAGIEIGTRTRLGGDSGGASSRREILEANQRAGEFFGRVYRHADRGRAARELVQRRGIGAEMVQAFSIGAAPDAWDGLAERLASKGVDPAPFVSAGLIKPRERGGGHYDAMRNRLIFPIRDQIGRVVAFGGRRINDEDEPKYLNSPEHAAFRKSSTLYGLYEASRAIQRERTAVVTEGYTDVIACHQAGFGHAVATLGTALTVEHARLLRRLCDTVILLFDSDEAGSRAADRATEVFFAEPLDVRIATFSGVTEAKDPDELLKQEHGAEAFRRVLDDSVDLLEYRYRRLHERLRGQGPAAVQRAIEAELETLGRLGLAHAAPMRRQLIIGRLAEITGLSDQEIVRAVPAGRARPVRQAASPSGASRDPGPGTPEERLAETLIGCVLCEPSLAHALNRQEWEGVARGAYRRDSLAELVRVLIDLVDQGVECTLSRVLAMVSGAEASALAVSLQRRIKTESESSASRVHALWRDCVGRWASLRELAGVSRDADVVSQLEARRRARAVAAQTGSAQDGGLDGAGC